MVRASAALTRLCYAEREGAVGRNASMLKRMREKPGAENCSEIAIFRKKQEKQCIHICKKHTGNKSV